MFTPLVLEPPHIEPVVIIRPAEQKPEPVVYTVKRGDNLEAIARRFKTSVDRLYAKNKGITDPDLITAGMVLKIPEKDEKLKPRDIIQIGDLPSLKLDSPPPGGYSSSGNSYGWHSCTWWAKWNRPNLPNSLGNAYEWVSNAQALGMATGSTPGVGAIGQSGNHVVYVIKVSGDQIFIGDGNYDWNGSYREIWVDASAYTYIY